MKYLMACAVLLLLFSSCKLLRLGSGREEKSGCPTTGRNIGAEKILAGDAKSLAAAKKAEKSKKGMSLTY